MKQRQLRNPKISEVNERSEASREREGAYQTEDKDDRENRQQNLKKSAQKHTDGGRPSYKKYNQLSPKAKQQYGNYSNYYKVKNQE
tara:strand:+ start:200 stop:457 length:258 start_codon:yes stop_codon:yes gene_type:complete